MLSWLKSLFSNPSGPDPGAICEYARDGEIGKVQALLEANPALVNANANQFRMTPLHAAAYGGRRDVAELLLAKGATVDARDRDAATPLFSAAIEGHAELVGLLLDAGADPCVRGDEEVTALHLAAMNGHLEAVKLLLKAGADPNARDATGTTPGELAEHRTVLAALQEAAGDADPAESEPDESREAALAEYRRLYQGKDDAAPGWEAINQSLDPLYPGQEPMHWGTIISHMLGGPDPIDGISAYQCREGGMDHLHFCTYGFTSLYYDEEAAGGDFSKYGFELTFRLASALPPDEEPIWACNLLQNLARYVFDSGRWFEEYHWIPANGPIRADYDTDLVGLVFLKDPMLEPIDTPHGRVQFIQMFGITQSELDSLTSKQCDGADIVERHRQTNPLLITDLSRRDG